MTKLGQIFAALDAPKIQVRERTLSDLVTEPSPSLNVPAGIGSTLDVVGQAQAVGGQRSPRQLPPQLPPEVHDAKTIGRMPAGVK